MSINHDSGLLFVEHLHRGVLFSLKHVTVFFSGVYFVLPPLGIVYCFSRQETEQVAKGFILQSIEHRTGIAMEVMGSNPVGASEFFSRLYL